MFDMPGFNPKSNTDDQLIEKMAELNKKILFMSYSTNGGSDMMMMMLDAFENEYRERQFMEQWRLSAPYMARTIETEPDLKKTEQEDLKSSKTKKKRIEVPARSNKPVIPDKD
jgi:hypothetical protein